MTPNEEAEFWCIAIICFVIFIFWIIHAISKNIDVYVNEKSQELFNSKLKELKHEFNLYTFEIYKKLDIKKQELIEKEKSINLRIEEREKNIDKELSKKNI